MIYKIILDKKDGNLFDITTITSKANLSLKRTGSCGSLQLELVKGDMFHQNQFEFENGDVISLAINNVGVFLGYIFKIEEKPKDETISITCYDQIKYLLYKATYLFENKKASDIIVQIANEFNLKLGEIEDTGYIIPKLLEDNKKILDIFTESLYLTADNGGKQYCLYDDFGKLTLKSLENMKTDLVLADNTYLTDVTYAKDIEDSYSVFKLVKDNEATGRRDLFEYKDSAKINKWGMLQYFDVVDKGLNDGQINNQLNALYKLKGKEKKTLSIKSIGEFVRGGESVAVIIDSLNIKQFFVVNEVKHTFENGNSHEMDIKLYIAD